jgi:hypothetical protein
MLVVTTPPEMLSVLGASRRVWPVGEVTITSRIEPSEPVTTRLTVPRLVPTMFEIIVDPLRRRALIAVLR